MEISKLVLGMIVKNYKAMCELLGEETTSGGNSKKSQIKEWERYIRFHKDGQKFIIDKIYEEAKDSVDNRKNNKGGNNITLYTENIEKLILNLLSQGKQGYGKIFLSKNQLLKELKMINPNYAFCKQRMPKLSQFMNINKATVEEWYTSASSTLERNLETALKSLENQALIIWSREITVVKIIPVINVSTDNTIIKTSKKDTWDEHVMTYNFDNGSILSHKEGTEEEKTFIMHTEREILLELNLKNKSEVITMGKLEVFIDKVNEILLKKYDIAYYYKSYKILFNEDHIYEVVEDLCDFALDGEILKQEEGILNNNIDIKVHKNVIRRQLKAHKEIDKIIFGEVKNPRLLRRISEGYIDDNDSLNSNLIIITSKDIRKKVKHQKIK